MILFPHAKINLGLNVVHKRDDGFHAIETVMVPIPLQDIIEAVVDPTLELGEIRYTRSGISIAGPVENDLCWRMAQKIYATRKLPGIRLHLHKVVPLGAGLGGGSSDAAHVLLLLNNLFDLNISTNELFTLAASLGSDCPFFLTKGPQFAEGRGEILRPIDLDLTGLWIVLVNPGVHVPTPEVYQNTTPTGASFGINWNKAIALLNQADGQTYSNSAIRELIPNIMEDHVFRNYPKVQQVWRKMIDSGAFHAAMSGSGSTVFGLFTSQPPDLEWPADHSSWRFQF